MLKKFYSYTKHKGCQEYEGLSLVLKRRASPVITTEFMEHRLLGHNGHKNHLIESNQIKLN